VALSQVSAEISDIEAKVFVDDRISGVSGYSDLSVIRLRAAEYMQLMAADALLSSAVYIVQDDNTDAYGKRIVNLAPPVELSDAANMEYVNRQVSGIVIPTDLSSFTNGPGYISAETDPVFTSLSGNFLTAHQSLDDYMRSSSAAPAYDPSKLYAPGDHVTHESVLYECAAPTSGEWDGTKWKATNMTAPDATLDITGEGRLAVVSDKGEVMWMEGYGLGSASSSTLVCGAVQLFAFPATTATPFDDAADYAIDGRVIYDGKIYKFTTAHAAGAWIGTDAVEDPDMQEFALPMPPAGIVGDFVLDVDNSANPNAGVAASLTGAMTSYDVYTVKGENISDLLTFAGGEMCELYFTMTAFGSSGKPAWKVVKQVVEKQEAGS